jgi:hypothetical protein
MPEEKAKYSRARDLLTVLVIVFATVFSVNLFSNWYMNHPAAPNEGYGTIQEKWKYLLNSPIQYDWLILGDSSAGRVDPTLIAQSFDATAINFGVIGSMLVVNDAWMLEAYIEKHGPPNHVLIVHVYDVWRRNVGPRLIGSLGVIPLSWGFWNRFGISLHLGLQDEWDLFVQRFISLYSRDQSIRYLLAATLAGDIALSDLVAPISTSREFNFPDNYTGLKIDKTSKPDGVERDYQVHSNGLSNARRPEISDPNQHALRKIISLAEKHDFHVYIANSPVYEKLAAEASFQKYYTRLMNTINELIDESERVHLLVNLPLAYALEDMSASVDHLLYPAARHYTNQLIEEINSLGLTVRQEN